MPNTTPQRFRTWVGPVMAVGSLLITLLTLEVAARVWTGIKWTDREIADVVEPVSARAGYVGHPRWLYALEPGFRRTDRLDRTFTHDANGIRRNQPLATERDSVFRVVMVGASTVYGIFVDDDSTSAAFLERDLQEHVAGRVEVVNLGVPGWTSRESVGRFMEVAEYLRPDVVVLLDGRNELFPQMFHGSQPDYGHFRILGWRLEDANRGWKALFRISRLAMVALHDAQGGTTLGYSTRSEDPVYGNIRYENQPQTLADLVEYQRDASRRAPWAEHVRDLIETTGALGGHTVLVKMVFRKEVFGSGTLPLGAFPEDDRPAVRDLLARGVAENNRILAETAARTTATFLPTDSLVREEWMMDDCHFNARGEAALAALIEAHLREVLPPDAFR